MNKKFEWGLVTVGLVLLATCLYYEALIGWVFHPKVTWGFIVGVVGVAMLVGGKALLGRRQFFSRKLVAICLIVAGLFFLVDLTRVGWYESSAPGFDMNLYFVEAFGAPLLLAGALLVNGYVPLYGMDVLACGTALCWGVFMFLLLASSHGVSLLERGFYAVMGYICYGGGLWIGFREASHEKGQQMPGPPAATSTTSSPKREHLRCKPHRPRPGTNHKPQ